MCAGENSILTQLTPALLYTIIFASTATLRAWYHSMQDPVFGVAGMLLPAFQDQRHALVRCHPVTFYTLYTSLD